MRRISPWGVILAAFAVAALTGCYARTRQEARLLVQPACTPGRVLQWLTGPEAQLVRLRQIDAHRRIKARDGAEIDTWLIKSRLHDPAGGPEGSFFAHRIKRGTVVLIHPMMTGKSWFLRVGRRLADRGFDVVLIDVRAHGFSGGRYVTWGVRERKDIKAVVDELLATEAISDRIYVCGSSMGGCIAIQYAAFDPRCRGVIALGTPAGLTEIARRMLWLTPRPQLDKALERAGEIAQFEPERASTVAAARKLHCPLIVVHGSMDPLVPAEQAKAIYQAAPAPKMYVPLHLAGHAPEIGRGKWLADQFGVLVKMGRNEFPPALVAARDK
jgi:pimeloyl-ACP methyl ester carboxylesterase